MDARGVEPEMDRGAIPVSYQLIVRRDVPNNMWFWMAGLFLLIPPIFKTVRSAGFESRRWRESDYGSALSKMGGGDD